MQGTVFMLPYSERSKMVLMLRKIGKRKIILVNIWFYGWLHHEYQHPHGFGFESALFGELGMNLSLTLSLYSRPHHDVQGERRESPLSAASKSAGFDKVCSPPL